MRATLDRQMAASSKGKEKGRKMLPLLVRLETGTDYSNRFIINPLFLWLMEAEMFRMKVIAEMFGLCQALPGPERKELRRN